MKRKVVLRGIIGIPTGIAIGFLITIIISLWMGDGRYYPCVPQLVETVGNEIGSVVLQTGLCALLGAVCAAASVIWEMETWSIVKQTGIYFIILSLTMLPIAFVTHWMEHTVSGILLYFGIFAMVFAAMWLIQYMIWKGKIKNLNKKMHKTM